MRAKRPKSELNSNHSAAYFHHRLIKVSAKLNYVTLQVVESTYLHTF